MAKTDTAVEGTEAVAKKTRKPAEPKPVFVVFNVLDEAGNPIAFDKNRINLIVATKSGTEALEAMDSGNHAFATYKAVMVKGR